MEKGAAFFTEKSADMIKIAHQTNDYRALIDSATVFIKIFIEKGSKKIIYK